MNFETFFRFQYIRVNHKKNEPEHRNKTKNYTEIKIYVLFLCA